MAYYRCGTGNSAEVLIDGVEVEEDIKLKSVGLTFKQVTRTMWRGYNLDKVDLIGVFADNNGFNALITDTDAVINRYLWNDSTCNWEVQSDVAPTAMSTLSNFARVNNKIYFLLNENTTPILYVYSNGTYTKLYTASLLYPRDTHTLIPSESDSNIIYVLGMPKTRSDNIYQKMYKYNISSNVLTEICNFVKNRSYDIYGCYFNGKIHVIGTVDYSSNTDVRHYTYTDNEGFVDTGLAAPFDAMSQSSIFECDDYLYIQTNNVSTNGQGLWRFDGVSWTCVTNVYSDEQIYFAFKHQNEQYVHRMRKISDSNAAKNDEGCIYKMISNAYERVV